MNGDRFRVGFLHVVELILGLKSSLLQSKRKIRLSTRQNYTIVMTTPKQKFEGSEHHAATDFYSWQWPDDAQCINQPAGRDFPQEKKIIKTYCSQVCLEERE
jgi:hypothetical protein